MAGKKPTPDSIKTSSSKRGLFYVAAVLAPIFLILIVFEIYFRLTGPHIDLWAQTGRRVGSSPMAS